MRIAVPDLVSNSYFPAAAADALGHYRAEGVDVSVVHIAPIENCVAALRDGAVDFIGASAHAPLLAFPEWRGVKLLCAQSQGMYWFLVTRRALRLKRGELDGLKGQKIAAVPFTAPALRRVLAAAGIDARQERISIMTPDWAVRPGVNFGVAAADALASGEIDGFFANGIGAEIAVTRGVGDIVLDIRRGDGPPECFNFTMPVVATTDRLIADNPKAAAAVVRAIVRTQRQLRTDAEAIATAGARLFPPFEAGLLGAVVGRDLPFYTPAIPFSFVPAMTSFAWSIGLSQAAPASYQTVVATEFSHLWDA
jgi:ABC-type nitrate/sulfonate/bicarbonate transport system substrate-binding protein